MHYVLLMQTRDCKMRLVIDQESLLKHGSTVLGDPNSDNPFDVFMVINYTFHLLIPWIENDCPDDIYSDCESFKRCVKERICSAIRCVEFE